MANPSIDLPDALYQLRLYIASIARRLYALELQEEDILKRQARYEQQQQVMLQQIWQQQDIATGNR